MTGKTKSNLPPDVAFCRIEPLRYAAFVLHRRLADPELSYRRCSYKPLNPAIVLAWCCIGMAAIVAVSAAANWLGWW